MEEENPAVVQSAQELMIEMETGESFDSSQVEDQMPMGQGMGNIPAYEMQQGDMGPEQMQQPKNMSRRMF